MTETETKKLSDRTEPNNANKHEHHLLVYFMFFRPLLGSDSLKSSPQNSALVSSALSSLCTSPL